MIDLKSMINSIRIIIILMNSTAQGKRPFYEETTENTKKIRQGVLMLRDLSLMQLSRYRKGLELYYPELKTLQQGVVEHIKLRVKYPYMYPDEKPKPSNSNTETGEKKCRSFFLKLPPLLRRFFTRDVDSQPQKKLGKSGYQLLKQQQQGQGYQLPTRGRSAQLEKLESQKAIPKKKVDLYNV